MIATDTNGNDIFINIPALKVEFIFKVEFDEKGKDEGTCITYVNNLPEVILQLDEDGHNMFCQVVQKRHEELYTKGLVAGQIDFVQPAGIQSFSSERAIKLD